MSQSPKRQSAETGGTPVPHPAARAGVATAVQMRAAGHSWDEIRTVLRHEVEITFPPEKPKKEDS